MDIVNVNIFIIYDCREINHFYTVYIRRLLAEAGAHSLNIVHLYGKKKKKGKGLRGITVNLVPPKPDHHCLPTGETVNTLADI